MKTQLYSERFYKSLKTSLTLFTFLLTGIIGYSQINYTENFNSRGQPAGQNGAYYWYFTNNIYPAQSDWNSIVPGDGFAYLKVDSDTGNDVGPSPYQSIGMGSVGPGHSMEVRMRNAVQIGLVGFIFTYNESGNTFNEIDIELVADDQDTAPNGHNISTNGGWTDVRFNTWRNANMSTFLPGISEKTRIKNAARNNVSHYNDDKFHTYKIDWYTDKIDYYIDGVKQFSTNRNIATKGSDIIIGLRDLVWAGPNTTSGIKTLQIDYLKVTPLTSNNNSPTQFRYDLGTNSSVVWPDYTRLSNTTRPGSFGWTNTNGIGSRDRGAARGRNNINRDINFSASTRTFSQNVSNGNWNVLITFGDTFRRSNMNVKAEGQNKLSNINTNAGQYLSRSFDVNVNDGKLDLEFSVGNGGDVWSITRIWIRKKGTNGAKELVETPEGFQVYPNPVNEILNIEVGEETNGSLSLYAITGEEVYRQNFTSEEASSIQINTSDLTEGLYLVHIRSDSGLSIIQKVVISH